MCGIVGIYGHPEAATLIYLGLHALQHRGQESAGITTSDGGRLRTYRGMGLVVDVFDKATLSLLPGRLGIGHVRYSTSGDSEVANAQPLAVSHARGQLALAHNGNLVNEQSLRRELETAGSIFTSNADSEVLVHLFARSLHQDPADRVAAALERVEGAYSLLFLTEKKLIAARDPFGFRPLCIGRIPPGEHCDHEGWVVASETCAFKLIGAAYLRMVEPGEVVVIDDDGVHSHKRSRPVPLRAGPVTQDASGSPAAPGRTASQPAGHDEGTRFCVFEHVYFARPDSVLGKDSIYASRRAFGRQLAREYPVEADVVIPVPDSGTTAALGYAQELGLPFEMGLIRSHYVGRTFIEPRQSIRHFGVKLKLAPVDGIIAGKRVVVVDDSLVRGTTSRKIVEMLREAGAAEVHLRISSPPTRFPCYYGIDTPTKTELIASNKSEEDIRRHVGCDTLGYLSLEGMLGALEAERGTRFCDACFSGDYPVAFETPGVARPLPLLTHVMRGRPTAGDDD